MSIKYTTRTYPADSEWKYAKKISDSGNKPFEFDKYTPVINYIRKIFPSASIWIDKQIPANIQRMRSNKTPRKVKPFVRIEELNLIIEFDGPKHYTDAKQCILDVGRDAIYDDLGYKVVRIPFWLPLSKRNILHLFDVSLNDDMCKLKYGFCDTSDNGITCAPGAMCEMGRDRFMQEFSSLPDASKADVAQDLYMCMHVTHVGKYILPDSMKSILDFMSDRIHVFEQSEPSELPCLNGCEMCVEIDDDLIGCNDADNCPYGLFK